MVEVPRRIADVWRQIELLVPDALGWGALSTILFVDWVILGDDPPLEWGMKIGAYLLGTGLVAARAAELITTCRSAIVEGFGVRHFREASADPGRTVGNARLPEVSRSRPILEAGAFVVVLVVIALLYIRAFLWDPSGGSLPSPLGMFYFFAQMGWNIAILILPVLAGRALGTSLVQYWGTTRRLWSRLWKGRMADWVFRFAGLGLNTTQTVHLGSRPTESLVAGAAGDLFGALPAEYRDRLEDLPVVLGRLEAAANTLRQREAELEHALVAVGAVGSSVDRHLRDEKSVVDTRDYESVRAHRAEVGAELDAARTEVGQRLASTMAALENLRLGLLRLRAGVGTPEELTGDLRAARELAQRVRLLLEGKRDVDQLLNEGERSSERGVNPKAS